MSRCEGRPEGACPKKRTDGIVCVTAKETMLCDDCDEYRFPTKPTKLPNASSATSMSAAAHKSTSAALVICEVLYFIQNKSAVLPADSIVSIYVVVCWFLYFH